MPEAGKLEGLEAVNFQLFHSFPASQPSSFPADAHYTTKINTKLTTIA
jgi:hypothetical protein